jgi:predicted phage terminase large subunit-like protein
VLAQEPWEVPRYPAIAEEDETYMIEAPVESRCITRARGEALHPEREPLDMLAQIRRTIGEYNFAGQYQQAPAPQGGGMIKAAWFASYMPNERPEPFDRIVQSWDTANKASELSDFSVCTSWSIKGRDLYLLHVLRRRMEYPELKRAVREQAQAFAASVVLIEDKASGTQLIQELVAEGLHAVTRYQPQSDKIMRMHAQTAMIESGFVHLPKEAPWLTEYLHELTAFPKGRHDDQVDSTAQMLDWFKRAGGGPNTDAGIWHLYRERYEAQQAGAPQPAKLPPLSTLLPLLRRL